jgi:asparagine synthase (glutamine-hydrolysing)
VLSIVSAQSVHALFREAVVAESEVDVLPQLWAQLAPLMGGTDELGGLQFLEVRSALPDELLLYADKISMAHSLELRVPFLDQEVIEFAECLPASFKVRHLQRKWLHRKIAGQLLPREILKRKKLGFASEIVDDWFRNTVKSSLIDVLRDGDSLMYRYLRHAVINRCLDEHQSGHADNHKLLFSLVVLEYVLRRLRSGVGAIGHI